EMHAEEYRCRGEAMVDYITEYLTKIREKRVYPDVQPGYMRDLLPENAPTDAEDWETIFQDFETVVMPGMVHWQSPHMHAYFPALTSWPSLLGDMLADAINCLGFTWASSPACTELEMNVVDWLCKALGLPSYFLHYHPESKGGGILQSTVSECTLVSLLAARNDKILHLKELEADVDDSVINSRLIAYASDQAHSSVEKAGLISLVKIRFLPTDENFSLRGETLQAPSLFRGVCSFDSLAEVGPVCAREGLWLHVDAAYAGSAFLCPELRGFLDGIEFADSFVFNPSKWMMVHFDCTAFWVKDKCKLQQTFSVDPLYLRHDNSGAIDFMHWQIPLSRRFRSLKLWFVMRSFGLKNLQTHIRHGVEMAKLFESLVRSDPNFEIPAQRHLGLVVFCLKGGNTLTQELLQRLTKSGAMFLIPAAIHTKLIVRFTVTSQFTTQEDILRDWAIIQQTAATVLARDSIRRSVSTTDETRKSVTSKSERKSSGEANCLSDQDESLDLEAFDSEEEQDVFSQDVFMVEWGKPESLMMPVLKKSIRSFSCSGALPPRQRDPLTAIKDGPSPSPGGALSVIPEKEDGVLGKKVLKKLTKFYSVPSFAQKWMQCGMQQAYCPSLITAGSNPSSASFTFICLKVPVTSSKFWDF
uniref:Histidine decarboxylase n=1 Tax=Denticeps clupeoides TaxID=299321 RepID=A0AAY4DT81_9TELE